MMITLQIKHFVTRLIKYDSKKVKLFVVTLLICSITCYSWLFYTLFRDRMKDHKFMDLEKCPACYGTSLCSQINMGNLELHGWSRLGPLDFVNLKNVHTGSLNGFDILLKKLGKNNDLHVLDNELCREAGFPSQCKVSIAIKKHPLVTAYALNPSSMEGLSDLVACPSQRLVNLIVARFREDPVIEGRLTKPKQGETSRMFLATTLMINPEPIIMQIFPAEEGWPFPWYEGACGRLVIVENVGPTLLTLYYRPWMERVEYAYQAMMIADLFTKNEAGFSLYWTDLKPENFAVNKRGKVIVVDLENIIVVDKNEIQKDKRDYWDEPYYVKHMQCPRKDSSCIATSVDKLCLRYTTDYNYYTMCRNLLSADTSDTRWSGGLLHGLPRLIEARLRPLIEECTKPLLMEGRMTVKDELIEELKAVKNLKIT